ncbi:unnamed protein product [Caenorhabditis brenneri]
MALPAEEAADTGLSSDSDDEKYNEDLPKSRVIEMFQISRPSLSGPSPVENHILIKSIETELNFHVKPTGSLFLYKNYAQTHCSIYTKTERRLSSPWKGMSSYMTGRLLVLPDPQCADPLILLLTKLNDNPNLLYLTGIFLAYEALPVNRIRVDFYLHQSRVLGSILEYNYQRKYATREQQYIIKLIIMGNVKEVKQEDAENNRDRRKADLDFEAFFEVCDNLKKKAVQIVPEYKLNEQNIKFPLMPYQTDTVRWMLHREADDSVDKNMSWMYECDHLPSGSSCYYYPHSLPADSSCFYYPHLGIFTRKKLDQQEELDFAKSNTLKGGILADEMGLGKTVQVLALISSHRAGETLEIENKQITINDDADEEEANDGLPNYSVADQIRVAEKTFAEMKTARGSRTKLVRFNVDHSVEGETIVCEECGQFCSASVCGWDLKNWEKKKFVCPICVSRSGARKQLKTTLIIVPESLIFQWFTEIGKHCSDGLRVLFYFGVKKHGYLHPDRMNEYDVILTTYDAIRAELDFSDVKELRTNLRRDITSLFLVSSLVHVHFWRVIVDESQLIPQNVTSKLPTMLSNIQGKNWWCVTGTPLVKTIADIFTLFTFLKLKPFGYPAFYSQYLHSEYLDIFKDGNHLTKDLSHVKLLQLLTEIMSRKTKKCVETQMKLPELTEIEKKICFTAVEERQYKDEKDRLRELVELNLKRHKDSAYVANLTCRDRVLHDLRSLQETVLTGQTSSSSLGSTANFTYAPETVIFRLIFDKKTSLANNLREFILNALALSGAQLLMGKQAPALAVYKHAFTTYEEFQKNTGLTEFREKESIKHMFDYAAQEEEADDDDELSRIDTTNEELVRARIMTGILKNVNQVFKKYTKNSADTVDDIEMTTVVKIEEELELLEEGNKKDGKDLSETSKLKRLATDTEKADESNNGEQNEADGGDLPGPSEPKRRCLRDGDDFADVKTEESNDISENNEVAERMSAEEEERKQKILIRKLVRKAGEPIQMDSTQEAHLMINLYKLELSLKPTEANSIPVERFEKLCNRYQKIEKDSLDYVRNELQQLNEIWTIDDEKLIDGIENFFTTSRWNDADNLSLLYDKDYKLNPIVKRDHFPNLPFIALYDVTKLVAAKTQSRKEDLSKHNTRRCMGRCEESWTFDPYAGEKCMKPSQISDLTMGQIERVDAKMKPVWEQMENLIEFVSKMTDPLIILDLLVFNKLLTQDEREQINALVDCEHILIKGTWSQREGVDKFYNETNSCKLCDFWCKLSLFCFHAGFASFHGWPRTKSSVFEFASYLINNFTPEKSEAQKFIKKYLRPYFERIEDVIKVFQQTASIIVELTDRFDELRTAQTLITDNQLDNFGTLSIELIRSKASDKFVRLRSKAYSFIQKEVKDIRYLVNLMEKQLTGVKDDFDECPVCKYELDSFMVYTCGHRVCPGCFEQIKTMALADAQRRELIRIPNDQVKCPTCRITNNPKQVMLACRGNTAENSIIRGVVLSAKLNCAIQLLRDILKEDSSNKIIVFTTFDPANNSSVWQYLLKILKLAKLPFAATSRSNCGKKVVDFEISTEIKILLCSLSMCGNGLNMTGANHIVFLDPPHLQSVLHQAMGRINRFGQKRAMTVHHLIVEGSLDSVLREIAKKGRGSEERKGWTVGEIRGMFGIKDPPIPPIIYI